MKVYALIFLFLALLWGVQAAASAAAPSRREADVSKLINATVYNQMFKYQKDPQCPSQGFYSYNAFIAAARYFGKFGFGRTGSLTARKRELVAFLAQTSHQTTGGWPSPVAPDGPNAWGYCHIRETTNDSYCKTDPKWPCVPGQKYYGRGPMQLTSNQYYGQAGKALGLDLLKNPDLVATDPIVSFKTAIWFWMTPQGKIPSCHDVSIGKWRPTKADKAARRVPGYGLITNIISTGECGHGADTAVLDRFKFYERYCDMLSINPGKNLDCYFQEAYRHLLP